MDKYVNLYKTLSSLPQPKSVFCKRAPNNLELISLWEERDLQRSEKIIFQRSHIVRSSDLERIISTSPCQLNNEQLRAYSTNGQLAILRNFSSKDGPEKQYIEIWKDHHKVKNIDVQSQERHLHILVDEQFGCFHWSPCNKYLLYVAEKYFKAESFFVEKSLLNGKQSGKSDGKEKGEEFLYRQSWGEVLQRAHHPKLYILEIETEIVTEVEGIDEDVSCGRAIWSSDGKFIIFVGWWHTPFRLGLIFCNNRRSAIFIADLESRNTSIIGASDKAVSFPRLSPNGQTLIYFQAESGGPHFNTQSLIKYDMKSKVLTTIVEVVASADVHNFPGLYVTSLPNRIWMQDNVNVIVNSIWRSTRELLCINTVTCKVTRLTNDSSIGCWELMDCDHDLIVACACSPSIKPYLVIRNLSLSNLSETWTNVGDFIYEELPISWKIFSLVPSSESINHQYVNLDFEAVLMSPVGDGPFPMIVLPHGGPHAVSLPSYTLPVDYFVQLGFGVLFVNYRGSIGFGQDGINSLVGNIGSQDISDVQAAVDAVLKTGKIDRNRVALYGGSHGGFLVLVMSALFPDFYKVCVARNPVVDVSAKFSITDIPDWCYAVTGLQHNFTSLSSPDTLTWMWRCSPIGLVDKIKIPVLFLLGKNDLRVPCHQGLLMYNALKARNVETRAYLYDDGHALAKVPSESDGLIHVAHWIMKEMQ